MSSPPSAKREEAEVSIVDPALASEIGNLTAGGSPLPTSARAFFEPYFGYDFSGVRVHTEGRATGAAKALKARAFTIGRRVVFGAGRYAPNSLSGRQLLAHELTHVVQQSRWRGNC